jgi:hypothetical protein
MIPGVPEFAAPLFFASLLGAGTDRPSEESSPRPAPAGAPHPSSKAARPLNAQPSVDAIAAFRDACRDCDARGVVPIRAGASR